MVEDRRHFENSSLREQYIEYVFLAGLCSEMWRRNKPMDVLRSQTDQSGYDLVLDTVGAIRFVQLKSSHASATTSKQPINVKLSAKPGGCVIWVVFDENTFQIDQYLWFGSDDPKGPCRDLGDKIAKRTTPKKDGTKPERQGIREVSKSKFVSIATVSALADVLFGT